MGSIRVDQITATGELVSDVDTTLSERARTELLLEALPGARTETVAGVQGVRLGEHLLLKKQITYLGHPWEPFKKRIQIPRTWIDAWATATSKGLTVHFIGVYRYSDVTIFVDFDPTTYVRRKANNSAAHVATNDLYQAQTLGVFSRTDKNGNRLTSVRADRLASYLRGATTPRDPRTEVFERFNADFLTGDRVVALAAVQAMYDVRWPDSFQNEWPGFYLEYRVDRFLRSHHLEHVVEFQKDKRRGHLDFDLVFRDHDRIAYLGDLKASSLTTRTAPGNDDADIRRCVDEYGRFWYVIYEHETTMARDNGDVATIAWNEWRRSVGYRGRKAYDPLSYASKFKESVRFTKMSILEVNRANFATVLGEFRQGHQPGGAARALKVMIKKKFIDNFLVFSSAI